MSATLFNRDGFAGRTYGAIERMRNGWRITELEPHVRIRLKAIFPRIPKTGVPPFEIVGGPHLDADLRWFLERYPLMIAADDLVHLESRKQLFEAGQAELATLLSKDWKPSSIVGFRDGERPYDYQAQAAELCRRRGRLLCTDDMGLGKTVTGIATITDPGQLPALIVPPTHLVRQWAEKLHQFTHLSVHAFKKASPYELPPADVYICPYSKLAGWIDYAETAGFKSVVFDEIQELRNGTSTAKGQAAAAFRANATTVLGLSGTPIYNYGSEIWQVMQFIDPDAQGSWIDFTIEWCESGPGGKWIVKDPKALGAYLREEHVMLGRTGEDVGNERKRINTITHEIAYDAEVLEEDEELMADLAIKVTAGSFTERGQAAREFDMRMRHATGVAKAPHVAAFVRILLEAGEQVLLGGWHRDCFAAGTPVLMHDGTTKCVEDVGVGDRVMGPDSQPRVVRSLVRGRSSMYRVTPKKGDPWVCSENHLLVLKSERGHVEKMTARQFAELTPRQQRSYVLFRSECVEFGGVSVIEPWLLGYWLGNGAADLRDLRLISDDSEVALELGRIAARNGLRVNQYDAPGATGNSSCQHFCLVADRKGEWGRNKLLNHFRSVGLTKHKHVPPSYRTSPPADRRELLAGLLDSDGYVHQGNGAGTAEFTNKSHRLSCDVAFVARSLGLAATISHEDRKTPYSPRIERYYRVTISGDLTQLPMRVERKRPPVRRQIKSVLHTGLSIEKIEAADFFGFEVDRDHLFLLGDFTVVHNCYDIWLAKLSRFNPVLYTGTESPAQKAKAKRAFIDGEARVIMLSLRSGAGLDGLQHVAHTAVIGELDWSPKVHDQFIHRLARPGQLNEVDAIYLVSDGGSDPAILDVCGLKASQSDGIINPLAAPGDQKSDATRIQRLAQDYLAGRGNNLVPAAARPMPAAALGPRQLELIGGDA